MATKKLTRRTPEQKIKDLEAKIAEIKLRASRKKVQRDPALRHVSAAMRSIDKAHAATSDKATRKAMEDARATLSACLALHGVTGVRVLRARSARASVDPKAVLSFLKSNPGAGGEQVASALGVDTASLRPVMKQLIEDGKASKSGKGRGTVYRAK
jgi:hypothetical protein